jgi:hypothetical protein
MASFRAFIPYSFPLWWITFGWAAVTQQQNNQTRRKPANRKIIRYSHYCQLG